MGSVGVARIAAGVTIGFKALPNETLPVCYSTADTAEADWAGIYPQLSLAQAIAYLPNQFERGYDTAFVVTLTTKKPVVIVTCSDERLMDGSVSSATKAAMVRAALKSLQINDSVTTKGVRDDLPLMQACGESEIVLCLPDAEGYELVVPKAMFTQEWLASKTLFTFRESKRLPSMAGSVDELPALHQSVLQDWDQLTHALETHTPEISCNTVIELVHASLQGQ